MTQSTNGGGEVILVGLRDAASTVRRGRILRFDGEIYDVEVVDGAPRSGQRFVLDSGRPDQDLAEVRVLEVAGNRVRFALERAYPRDKRLDPRVDAEVAFTWHALPAVPGDDALRAWSRQGRSPGDAGPPRRPSTLLNLSASGLAFDDRDPPSAGQAVLFALEIPGRGAPLRCAGRVVNVRDLSTAERQAHPDVPRDARHVAVELVGLESAERQALLELVVDRQRLPGESPSTDAP